MTLPVTMVQRTALPDPLANAAAIEDFLRANRAQVAGGVVVWPEATMAPFGVDLRAVAEPLVGRFATRVREAARAADALVVVGMFEPADGTRVYNTVLVTDGLNVDAAYRKIHLYDAFGARESDTVAPGHELVCVDHRGTRIGVAACYDVRFADQFTALGRAGAEVICLPASWGDGPGKIDQWRALTTARAMDAQAWLVACDQPLVDTGGRRPLGVGHSRVVAPLGECCAEAGVGGETLMVQLDLDAVARARAAVPVLGATPVCEP